jgi:hypothetical protein
MTTPIAAQTQTRSTTVRQSTRKRNPFEKDEPGTPTGFRSTKRAPCIVGLCPLGLPTYTLRQRSRPVAPIPVLYAPSLADWRAACRRRTRHRARGVCAVVFLAARFVHAKTGDIARGIARAP